MRKQRQRTGEQRSMRMIRRTCLEEKRCNKKTYIFLNIKNKTIYFFLFLPKAVFEHVYILPFEGKREKRFIQKRPRSLQRRNKNSSSASACPHKRKKINYFPHSKDPYFLSCQHCWTLHYWVGFQPFLNVAKHFAFYRTPKRSSAPPQQNRPGGSPGKKGERSDIGGTRKTED